ncbi:MAG: hypothetical protein WA117_12085 [Verrucomicrobiia bacterium]
MTEIKAEWLIQFLGKWLGRRVAVGKDVSCYQITQRRISQVLFEASREQSEHYHTLAQPSPIKTAAALCVAISKEEPLHCKLLKDIKDKEEWDRTRRMTQRDNAVFALCASLYLLSTAKFKCKPNLMPPFDIPFPSNHFAAELIWALSNKQLTTPGVALIFELMLYNGNKGGSLRGCIDKPNPMPPGGFVN